MNPQRINMRGAPVLITIADAIRERNDFLDLQAKLLKQQERFRDLIELPEFPKIIPHEKRVNL